jgi:LPXTG-site transpeptidase (sortase) family protein
MALRKEKRMTNLSNKILKYWETIIAGILILVGVVVLSATYWPVLKEEIKYQFSDKGKNTEVMGKSEQAEKNVNEKDGSKIIVPVDEEFGIIIPKISANAKVIADVDSQNSAVYQRALTKGVAQAKGTAFPDEEGNIFIFAHSSADFLEASRFNAVFYLLSKLETGDEIFLFYKGEKYSYVVSEKKTVGAEEASYLEKNTDGKKLTLMTCWPPGTTLKRLIIIAKPID